MIRIIVIVVGDAAVERLGFAFAAGAPPPTRETLDVTVEVSAFWVSQW